MVPVPIPTTTRIPAWVLIGAGAALQLLAVTAGSSADVAWWAHVGGFVFGAGWGLDLRVPRRWPTHPSIRAFARAYTRRARWENP